MADKRPTKYWGVECAHCHTPILMSRYEKDVQFPHTPTEALNPLCAACPIHKSYSPSELRIFEVSEGNTPATLS